LDGFDKAWLVLRNIDWAVVAASFTEKLASFGGVAFKADELDLDVLGVLWVGSFWAGFDWLVGEAHFVVVLHHVGLFDWGLFIIVVGETSAFHVVFVTFVVFTRVRDWLVFFAAVGLFQIGTAFIINKREGLVEGFDVAGQFVVIAAEFVFGIIIEVTAKTALGVLVELGELNLDLHAIEADGDVAVGEDDQIFAVVKTEFAELFVFLNTATVDLNLEFARGFLWLNFDGITGDDLDGLGFVVDLLHENGEAWALA